jgi:radical SAM protein with 4Fe4S-binding SPASM domain
VSTQAGLERSGKPVIALTNPPHRTTLIESEEAKRDHCAAQVLSLVSPVESHESREDIDFLSLLELDSKHFHGPSHQGFSYPKRRQPLCFFVGEFMISALQALRSSPHQSSLLRGLKKLLLECLGEDSSNEPKYGFLAARIRLGGLREKLASCNAAAIGILQNAGLPQFDADNPLHLISALHPMRRTRLTALKLARKLDINVTDICNFSCEYCYQRSRDGDWRTAATSAAARHLDATTWRALLEEAAAIGVTRVKFTGGEPLTRPDFNQIWASAFGREEFEEVELVTNASLLSGDRLEDFLSVVASGKRVHIHLSVDGYEDGETKRSSQKVFSPAAFQALCELSKRIPYASFSVNSMWTSTLLEQGCLERIHEALTLLRPKRWSISLPYLVADVVDAVRTGALTIPSFDEIIAASRSLIALHNEHQCPFPLSIPLIWKDEAVRKGTDLSTMSADDSIVEHPCFPCHGSYFIVGPQGEILECLLLSASSILYPMASLMDILLTARDPDDWYDLHPKVVNTECWGCRYYNLCKGQCPNDRANAAPQNHSFGRDLSACSLLRRAEEIVWPSLPDEGSAFCTLVDATGFRPATWPSLSSIIAGDTPNQLDSTVTGDRPLPFEPQAVSVRFHQRTQCVTPSPKLYNIIPLNSTGL